MRRILCIVAAAALFSCPCFAAESDMYERQYDALGIDELRDAVPDDAADIELSEDISLNDGLGMIWDKLKRGVGDIFSGGLRCVTTIVVVSMLCSSVGAMSLPQDNLSVKTSLSLVGAIAVTGAASGSITSVIGMGREFISSIDLFSKSLLPTLAAAEAAVGTPSAAIAKTGAAVLFSDVLITLINYVFIPLVYINIFAATANAAARNESLRRISDLSVKVVSSSLKFILGAFVSYITVSGLVSGSVDKAGLKTAQFAIGGTVPVVGGIISEAAETVIAGASLIKNTIGVFGMLVVLAACVTPFATLAINYFLFKFASVCVSPLIGGSLAELTDRLGQSFGLVLAMSASCVTVIFISIVAAMRSVGVL